MKKKLVFIVLAALLAGCYPAQETFETVADVYAVPAAAFAREIKVDLPYEATVLALKDEDAGSIYFCNDYTVTIQTAAAGDLDGTIRSLTGYGQKELTVIETLQGACARYDFVWTSAGETGEQVGRAAILDDGNYHYCLTAMADAAQTTAVSSEWERLFNSFWAV